MKTKRVSKAKSSKLSYRTPKVYKTCSKCLAGMKVKVTTTSCKYCFEGKLKGVDNE